MDAMHVGTWAAAAVIAAATVAFTPWGRALVHGRADRAPGARLPRALLLCLFLFGGALLVVSIADPPLDTAAVTESALFALAVTLTSYIAERIKQGRTPGD